MNKKDLILKTMISSGEINPYFTYKSLNDSLFPELNIDQVKFLIDNIILKRPELINRIESILDNDLIQPTGLVNDFLKNGGFTELEKQEKERLINENKLKDLELKLAKSNIAANKLNKKVAKRNRRETIINIILGLLNIGILIWQLLKAE